MDISVFHLMNLKRHHRNVLLIGNFVPFCVMDTYNGIGRGSLACKFPHFDMDSDHKRLRDEHNVVALYRLDTHNDNQMNHHLNKFHHSNMDLVSMDLALGLMQHIQTVHIHFRCIAMDNYTKHQIAFVYKLPMDGIGLGCHIDSLCSLIVHKISHRQYIQMDMDRISMNPKKIHRYIKTITYKLLAKILLVY